MANFARVPIHPSQIAVKNLHVVSIFLFCSYISDTKAIDQQVLTCRDSTQPCDTAASDQRVVSISGREEAGSQASPAIDALMYCAAPVLQEEGDPQKCVRLVVPSSQVRRLFVWFCVCYTSLMQQIYGQVLELLAIVSFCSFMSA